jgi:hypothetical protein
MNPVTIRVLQLEAPSSSILEGECHPVDWSGQPKFLASEGEEDEEFKQTVLSESERFYNQLLLNKHMLKALEALSAEDVSYLESKAKKQFINNSWAYYDVLSFDEELINNYDKKVTTYAIVISEGHRYQGHVYVWISPRDPNWCLMIGIRNRVDSVFLKDHPGYLPNVSHYLIEACEKFAVHNGCKNLVIVFPLEVMSKMARQRGYQEGKISSILTDNSVLDTLNKSSDPDWQDYYREYPHLRNDSRGIKAYISPDLF